MKHSVFKVRHLVLLLCSFGFFAYCIHASQSGIGFTTDAISDVSKRTSPPDSLTNPLLAEAGRLGLDFHELQSFKAQIESKIKEVKNLNPDLHVSYYFRDLNNGLWIGINEKENFAPASLLKVPLMLAVLKEAESNPLLLSMGFNYQPEDFKNVEEEAGFKREPGKFYVVNDLLRQMICYSDNGASLALLRLVGDSALIKVLQKMNYHVTGSFSATTNFVNVKSYAGAFRILYNSAYLNHSMSEKALKLLSEDMYKDGIRRAVPSEIMVAHKYGKRDIQGEDGKLQNVQLHHFGIVYHPSKPFIIGVMTRGATLKVKEQLIYDLSRITWKEVSRQAAEPDRNVVFPE